MTPPKAKDCPTSDDHKHRNAFENLFRWCFNPVSGINSVFSHLCLSQKIKLGYTLAVGIAVLGIATGIISGDRFENQANNRRISLRHQRQLLNKLHDSKLNWHPLDELSPYLQEPIRYQQAKSAALALVKNSQAWLTEFDASWVDLSLSEYSSALGKKYQDLQTTLKTEKIPLAKKLLVNLGNSPSQAKVIEFTQQLPRLISRVEELAEIDLRNAKILRLLIVGASMTFSTAITLNQLFVQIKSLEAAQIQTQIAADAANLAKSEFLVNMSDEFRTPLNGILGYAQILPTGHQFTKKEQRGIQVIQQCGKHLLILINDILDYSKIEVNNIKLEPNDFHLPTFLQDVVEICRIKAQQKDLQFIYYTPPDLPIGITAAQRRLRKVLINLLNNAIKFTQSGSVTLQIDVLNTRKVANSTLAKIMFFAEDTGIGINDEQIDKIFLPFEQSGERKIHVEGAGLGLAISQKIVEMMDGRIQVESDTLLLI